MRRIIIASIIFSFIFAVILPTTSEAAAATKPMKGKVVSLDDVVKGKKDLQLNKEKAKELFEQGSPLVFLYNKKIYFVQTESGDFAFKKLADYAHKQNVGIVGKIKPAVYGINVIIMSNIESMD